MIRETRKLLFLLFLVPGLSFGARISGGGGGGATTLNGLTDVDDSGRTKNDALLFNGTEWVAAAQGTSFTFSINTFTDNVASTIEMGPANDPWKTAGQLIFSATYNNGPPTDSYVSHAGWANLTMTSSFEGPTANVDVASYPASPGSKTWTLHSTDGVDSDTKNSTIYFYNNRHWGVTSTASGYVEGDIEGLAGSELSNSKAKTFTVNAGAGEYILYCYPSRLGTATFTVGGFEGGFQSPETVSVTNASGYTENYYAYRSTNHSLGSTTVVVQ